MEGVYYRKEPPKEKKKKGKRSSKRSPILKRHDPSKTGYETKYTPEYLEELAIEMEEFVLKDKSVLFVREFFTKKKIHMSCVYGFKDNSDEFTDSFELCQQTCADRVQRGVLTNKLNGQYAAKFVHFFDKDLYKADKERKKEELEQTLEVTKKAELKTDGFQIVLKVEKE